MIRREEGRSREVLLGLGLEGSRSSFSRGVVVEEEEARISSSAVVDFRAGSRSVERVVDESCVNGVFRRVDILSRRNSILRFYSGHISAFLPRRHGGLVGEWLITFPDTSTWCSPENMHRCHAYIFSWLLLSIDDAK